MHVLLGALIGGVLGLAFAAVTAAVFHRKITAGSLIGAFAGGALAGGIAASTFGVSVVAAGGVRAAGFLALEGGLSGSSSQVVQNEVDHQPVLAGVARSTAIGAAAAPLSWLGGRTVARILPASITAPLGRVFEKVPPIVRTSLGYPPQPVAETASPSVAAGIASPVSPPGGPRAEAGMAQAIEARRSE